MAPGARSGVRRTRKPVSALFSRRSGRATYAPSPPSSCAARRSSSSSRDSASRTSQLISAMLGRASPRASSISPPRPSSLPLDERDPVALAPSSRRTLLERLEDARAVAGGQRGRERAREPVRPEPHPGLEHEPSDCRRRRPSADEPELVEPDARRAPPITPASATSSGRSRRSRAPRMSGTRYGVEAPRISSCSSRVERRERILAALQRDERLGDGRVELRADVALDLGQRLVRR